MSDPHRDRTYVSLPNEIEMLQAGDYPRFVPTLSNLLALAFCFVLVFCLIFLSTVVRADTIELSMSPYGRDCQMINDSGPGLRTVYVNHVYTFGSRGARFKLSLDPGATLMYVSETHAYSMTVGNTQDGISICYGACVVGGMIASVTYMYLGSTVNCPRLRVVPHPDAETVDVIDCYGVPQVASVSDMFVVAPGQGCGCPISRTIPGAAGFFDCTPLPIESKTWGGIKALYRR